MNSAVVKVQNIRNYSGISICNDKQHAFTACPLKRGD